MNRLLCIVALMGFMTLGSCGDQGEHARSTPIDSTNVHGTAPVQYDKSDSIPMLPDARNEEGAAANTPDGDSLPSTRPPADK